MTDTCGIYDVANNNIVIPKDGTYYLHSSVGLNVTSLATGTGVFLRSSLVFDHTGPNQRTFSGHEYNSPIFSVSNVSAVCFIMAEFKAGDEFSPLALYASTTGVPLPTNGSSFNYVVVKKVG